MTLGSELWNVNDSEIKDDRYKILCDKCGCAVLEEEATRVFDNVYGFDYLCQDCLTEYAEGIAKYYVDDFIEQEREKEFYWTWFNNLGSRTQLELIKEAFDKPKYWGELSKEGMEERQEFHKKYFCNEDEDFLPFVVDIIKGNG